MRTLVVLSLIGLGCAGAQSKSLTALEERFEAQAAEKRALEEQVRGLGKIIAQLKTEVATAAGTRSTEVPAGAGALPDSARPRVAVLPPRAAGGLVAYIGQPPQGWGGNSFSVTVKNKARRWADFAANLVDSYCYAALEVDGQPVTFVRPSGMGAQVVHYPVRGRYGTESRSLLPPDSVAYFFVPDPGKHTWKAYCYDRPPQTTQIVSGQIVPVLGVLRVIEYASGDLQTISGNSTIYIHGDYLSPIAGRSTY